MQAKLTSVSHLRAYSHTYSHPTADKYTTTKRWFRVCEVVKD